MPSTARFQIGETARRTGVSPVSIRAWETRYRLVQPERSPGGTRLYSVEDLARIQAMKAHIASGLSAAQAAEIARDEPLDLELATQPAPTASQAIDSTAGEPELTSMGDTLASAFRELDHPGAQRAMEALLTSFALETVCKHVILPYLFDVGRRWQAGEASIAEEHLAANLLRARFLAPTFRPEPASSRRAVLACPPEERHDLALAMCGAIMVRHGWTVAMLGADTPIVTIAQAAEDTASDTVIMCATYEERFLTQSEELRALSRSRSVYLAGPGATARAAREAKAHRLDGDPVDVGRSFASPA